jgi:parallel beta-helix repeat protein
MKLIFSFVFVCSLNSAWASTYYFSTSSGNDSRTSSQAKNPSTPWRTISKLNSFFSKLQPGDEVLFKRGETFYGSIIISRSGTSSSPITIGAYGSGNKPIITSLITLSGWTRNSSRSGVYDVYNSKLGSTVNIVLFNNVQKGIGRYPNSNASNKGYLTLESHYGTSSITDNQLSSSPNWTGAEVVIRTSHWLLNRCKITNHSGGKIYYSRHDGQRAPRNKYGYFIVNSVKTLDQLGEWSYKASTKRLSMYFGSNSPSSHNIKVSTVNDLVRAGGKSYIVFTDLALKGANENGFDFHDGNSITVKNCDVSFSGDNGISASGSSRFLVENCTVTNSNNNGIFAVGSSSYAVVRNNTVINSYTFPGLGKSGEGQGAGIKVGKTGLAEYNNVINSGFNGITMGGDYCVVRNNFIDGFCFVKDDGGGVYTHNGSKNTNYGRRITGNIIINGQNARAGTDAGGLSETGAVGISSSSGVYLDGNTNGVEISGNSVANAARGVFLHNTNRIVIRGNTFFNNRHEQVYMKHDAMGGLLRKITVTKNILFAKMSNQLTTSVNTNLGNSDISSIGRIDSNFYARPTKHSDLVFTTTYLYTSSQVRKWHDLSEWKSKYNKDYRSTLSSKTISSNPDYYIKFFYNATKQDSTFSFSGTYVDAKSNKFYGKIVLKPYSAAVLIKDGSSGRSADSANKAPDIGLISGDNLSYTATVKLTADASDSDGTISSVGFYNGRTLLYSDSIAPYTFDWTNVPAGTYTITARATDNRGAVTTSAGVKVAVISKANLASVNNNPSLEKRSLNFKLFPNPAVNNIHLNFKGFLNNERATLTILNISGSTLKTFPVVISGRSLEVDISSLNTGMFIVRLSGQNFSVSGKFLKIN